MPLWAFKKISGARGTPYLLQGFISMMYVLTVLLIIIIVMMLGMWQGLVTMNTNMVKCLRAIQIEIKALKTNKEDL